MLSILFYVAITADAMTAALAAGRRNMDWFGVCLIACITALGGGTARDLFLNHYPLYWVHNPYILLLVCGAALLTIAMLASLGRLDELGAHIRATRNTGVTKDEVKEVLLQVAVYAGAPAANSAFAVAKRVYKEMETEGK